MLICHKLGASNESADGGTASISYVTPACSIGSVDHASVVRGCLPVSASSSLIYHFWFLKHHHSAATRHDHHRCKIQLSYPWKLHAGRANNYYFLYIFLFCSMYLVLFSIVLYRRIVTVYTDDIFLYNYRRQMHQIIIIFHLWGILPQHKVKVCLKIVN